jgi:hypothetical protein
MTCIAWDGKTLAADKAATNSGHSVTVTKIHRVGDGLVALAGDEAALMAGLVWLRGVRNPADYPEVMKTTDSVMWEILPGEFKRYTSGPYPARVESAHMATGCGRDYALAAMYLGHDARRAVEVACALDNSCGNGIDTLELPA